MLEKYSIWAYEKAHLWPDWVSVIHAQICCGNNNLCEVCDMSVSETAQYFKIKYSEIRTQDKSLKPYHTY